jgi:S-adenosylmethionine/arginine decarboxylase-like enzyme
MTWGQHLILDCKDCNVDSINNSATIRNFVSTLIERIGMIGHGPLQLEFLLPGTANEGYSLLQMITTSNITAHFVNSTKAAYIDVFSCKEFNSSIVVHTVQEFFDPTDIKTTLLLR